MNTLEYKLRRQLRIRPMILAGCVLALGVLLLVPVIGSGLSGGSEIYQVSDDVTDVATPNNAPDPNGTNPGDTGNTGGGIEDNQSGLGDGSNPGQGEGTANGPNEGTDNPNNAGNP